MTDEELEAIRGRVKHEDARALLAEVDRLRAMMAQYALPIFAEPDCEVCGGKGFFGSSRTMCPTCGGTGKER